MSLEILKKINDAVNGAGGDDASALQAAALQAAANASSLGPTILNKADDISKVIDNPEGARDLVIGAINDMPNLAETSNALNNILPDPGTPAFDAFVEKASADDLATAAAVLLAAEAKNMVDDEDYIKNFNPAAPDLSDSAKLAVELAKAASGKFDEDDSNSRLKDILGGLNLVPN
jgi:hypothetical protein